MAQLTLFAANCPRCGNLGLWSEPSGTIGICPALQVGEGPHPAPDPAQTVIARAVQRLKLEKLPVDPQMFDVVRYLSPFSSSVPCPRAELLERFFSYSNISDINRRRRLMLLVEDLRKTWLLPVGSRKEDPSGYWIITELDDFKDWFDRTTAAPITQLTTIHRLAKHNFPLFAEQIEFDFFNEIEADGEVADAA